jgi:putative transposase
LTIVDNFTCECLSIEVAQNLSGEDVVAMLQRLRQRWALPARIQADNGPGFTSLALDRFACDRGVTLDYSRPGKPTDNPFIESFNGSLRDECLNTQGFLSHRRCPGKDRIVESGLQSFSRIRRSQAAHLRCSQRRYG